ncbi:3D domain-containing protein [Paenibacillus sp. SC116]|uniref:3D domain-containing protein n=1 Tax=Paenibacillus sp. SC116 TaxID=2968986 RepID=UPI00215B3B5E|nr:3D domain-containing protein [Paenibacillus sp. SC116]MCR8842755.1 3D domain-containing protein [Paenibacillus sp. SC116]
MNKKMTLQIAGVLLVAILIIQILPVYAESNTATELEEQAQSVPASMIAEEAANPMINEYELWGNMDQGIPDMMAVSLKDADKPVQASAPKLDEKKDANKSDDKETNRKPVEPVKVATAERKSTDEKVSKSPKNVVSVNGKAMTFKRTYNMKATSYTDHPSENGWGPIDALGNPLKLGTVAVDPDVIPLGTKLFITGYQFKHLPEGGLVATATDTGGKIKGNKVDIFLPLSQKEARKFGVQDVQVYVLK